MIQTPAMNRRDALKTAGLLTAGFAVSRCSSRPEPSAPPKPKRKLAPVQVSKDRIIRTVVGLRPFRSSGFRVEKEKLGRKIVVHNYGHGGGGITLSWGTSLLAVEELFRDDPPQGRVAVLGAGAVGLATARLLQRRGIEVTLYAKDLPPHTTSNVAAGQWSPYFVSDFSKRSARFKEQFAKAARLSHRQFQDLLGDYYGVHFLMNYVLSEHPFGPEPGEGGSGNEDSLDDLFPESRAVPPGEHPFPVKHVRQFQTMLIEPPVYLEALLRDFLLAKGTLVIRELRSAGDLQYLPEAAIVNCTGLGSSSLFDDTDLVPVKGQLTFVLPQPEVDYVALYGDLYMMPRKDGILLGGTHERGNWSLAPDMEAFERIVAGHQKLFGALS
ncbi:MAG TPA: FAD-dependent oxidoreductase [Vicinamibacteria bacterium]|nr:FAD-dependent oxidoreductase [Vicinamibacteria bacterium]